MEPDTVIVRLTSAEQWAAKALVLAGLGNDEASLLRRCLRAQAAQSGLWPPHFDSESESKETPCDN
ncbi:MAG: hypothetical protein ACUVWR_04335 [Anaerolineae bacterium]